MDISKEIQIFNDLDINLDNLVNSSLDVFEDCILLIDLNNRTKLNKYVTEAINCLLYTSPSPRDQRGSRMPASA